MVMEDGDTVEPPVITAMEFNEDLPNADEAAFPVSEPQEVSVSVNDDEMPNVLVATSHDIITSEQFEEAGLKATHIVIHDQSAIDVFKTAQASLAAQASEDADGSNGEVQKYKYNWDVSVHDAELLVRCRNVSGFLHKNKFGSGGRGRCIKSGVRWYTPSEFEALCGRGSSKDWKRSIRYAGRTLLCLIEDGILMPHATSCTCAACCDDMVVSGPVRLYTPYKRRRRDEPILGGKSPDDPPEKPIPIAPAPPKVTVTLAPAMVPDTCRVVVGNLVDGGSILSDATIETTTPVSTPLAPRFAPTALDFGEQRMWWQLEEMVKNLVKQVQELQKQVDIVKAQGVAAREAALQQLRIQLENEKKEALNSTWVESQMSLSRSMMEARAEKELAVQQAFQRVQVEARAEPAEKEDTAKRCGNCNREAFSECTGCHRISYCSAFCQRKDWASHQDQCGEDAEQQQHSDSGDK
ncbi:hypothetical protein HPB47_010508 [Ixodes persulcatus]|uniref:Uncharacterized protein n=1 Tax=Ixodes persulcatus TaxID=34615 RepID=A0AC60NYV1_IXOPE|nr:hypothetical protein HPB47_010508 [Ixodes persulcatus]